MSEWQVIKPKKVIHHDIRLLDGSIARLNCTHKEALSSVLDTLYYLSDEYVTQMNESRLFADKREYDRYYHMSEALRIVINQFFDECTEV